MRKSFTKVLSLLMALMMIVGSFSAIAVSAADCDHANNTSGEIVKEQEATCGKDGFVMRKCDLCGDEYTASITIKTGDHKYVIAPETAATCTSAGLIGVKKCSVCGEEDKTEATANPNAPALGHNWVEKAEASATDCTVGSYKWFECSRCNKTAEKADTDEKNSPTKYDAWYKTELVEKKDNHTFVFDSVTLAPTTCDDGIAKFVCSNKGCQVTKTEAIPATHTPEDVPGRGGSCSEYAADAVWCKVCHTLLSGSMNDDVHHTWEALTSFEGLSDAEKADLYAKGFTTVASLGQENGGSCKTTATYVGKCSVCEEINTNLASKNNGKHTWEVEVLGGETTNDYCSTEKAWYQTCSACDVSVKGEVVAEAVAHNTVRCYEDGDDSKYDDKLADIEKYCLKEYKYTDKCTECDKYPTSDGYKTTPEDANVHNAITSGHSWSAWSATKGTDCSTTGFYQIRTCSKEKCDFHNGDVTKTPLSTNISTTVAKDKDTVEDQVKVIVKKGTAHVLSSSTKEFKDAANCQTKAYKAKYCTVAGCSHIDSAHTETDYDTTKHPSYTGDNALANTTTATVGGSVDNTTITKVTSYSAPTCGKTGSIEYYCSCGNSGKLTAEIAKKAHGDNIVTDAEGTATDGSGIKYNVKAVTETCAADGWTAGSACKVCGTVTAERVKVNNLDGTKAEVAKHSEDALVIIKENATATCQEKVYKKYECTVCGLVFTVESGNLGTCNWDNKALVPATCLETGKYAHQACTVCKEVRDFSTIIDFACCKWDDVEKRVVCENADRAVALDHNNKIQKNVLVISATGHSVVASTLATDSNDSAIGVTKHFNATCTLDGVAPFEYCENAYCDCDLEKDGDQQYMTVQRVLSKHGNTYWKEYTPVTPKCDEKGFGDLPGKSFTARKLTDINLADDEKEYYCTVCDAGKVGDLDPAHNFTGATLKKYNDPARDNYDCTKITVSYYECTVDGCDGRKIDSFVAAKSAHKWNTTSYEHKVVDGFVVDTGDSNSEVGPACTTPTYKYTTCTNTECDQVKIENRVEATNTHYYLNDSNTQVTVKMTCADYKAHVGQTTACCEKLIVDKDVADGKVAANEIGYAHNKVTSTVNATCTSAGGTVTTCLTCGDTEIEGQTKALNPDHIHATAETLHESHIAIMNEVKETATTDGYKEYRCPLCKEIVREILPATGADIATNVVDKTNAFNGGSVKVEVSVTSEEFVFSAFTYKLYHNANLVFGELAQVTDIAGVRMFANAQVDDTGANYVSVTVMSAENCTISGTEAMFTLTFDILPAAYKAGFTTVSLDNVVKNGDDGVVAVTATAAGKGDYADFETAFAGSATGSSELTISDALAIQNTVLDADAEYTAYSDFNNDGVVDMLDFAAFMKFIGSQQSFYDLLVLQGVDLAEVVAESGVVIPDVDGNTVTDQTDINLVAQQLIKDLKAISYKTSVNMVTYIEAAIAKL